MTQVVILAAGKGTRFRSKTAKPLQKLGGRTLIDHIISQVQKFTQDIFIVVGQDSNRVKKHLSQGKVEFVSQVEQKGTAHALLQALPLLDPDERVLVLYCDVPLISEQSLTTLEQLKPGAIGLLTAIFEDPTGLGRIIRDDSGNLKKVVEQKVGTPAELAVKEINSGIFIAPVAFLNDTLPRVNNDNAQGEFLLPDIFEMAVAQNIAVELVSAGNEYEVMGVNDPVQLAQLERYYQFNLATHWMQQGVRLADPHRIDIRGAVQIGQDVDIDVNVILQGNVIIGDDCKIGPNCYLKNAELGRGVTLKANSVIENSKIEDGKTIGPHAHEFHYAQ